MGWVGENEEHEAVVVQKYTDRKAVRLNVSVKNKSVELLLVPPYWEEETEPNERDIVIIGGVIGKKSRRKRKWIAERAWFPKQEQEENPLGDPIGAELKAFREMLVACSNQAGSPFHYLSPDPCVDFKVSGLNGFLQSRPGHERKAMIVFLFGLWFESSKKKDGLAGKCFGEEFYQQNCGKELFIVFSPVGRTISAYFNAEPPGSSRLFFEIFGTKNQINEFLNEFIRITGFRAASVSCSNGAIVYEKPSMEDKEDK